MANISRLILLELARVMMPHLQNFVYKLSRETEINFASNVSSEIDNKPLIMI